MIQIIDWKEKYTQDNHILSNMRVFTKHLIDTVKLNNKFVDKTQTVKFNNYKSTDRIVVIDDYLWVKLEEYLFLLESINFNLEYLEELKLTYIAGFRIVNGSTEEYYNAEYKFIFIKQPELFPACEADVVSIKIDEFGITKGIKVEKNNNCI